MRRPLDETGVELQTSSSGATSEEKSASWRRPSEETEVEVQTNCPAATNPVTAASSTATVIADTPNALPSALPSHSSSAMGMLSGDIAVKAQDASGTAVGRVPAANITAGAVPRRHWPDSECFMQTWDEPPQEPQPEPESQHDTSNPPDSSRIAIRREEPRQDDSIPFAYHRTAIGGKEVRDRARETGSAATPGWPACPTPEQLRQDISTPPASSRVAMGREEPQQGTSSLSPVQGQPRDKGKGRGKSADKPGAAAKRTSTNSKYFKMMEMTPFGGRSRGNRVASGCTDSTPSSSFDTLIRYQPSAPIPFATLFDRDDPRRWQALAGLQ